MITLIPVEVWAALGAIIAAIVAWFGLRRSGAKAERSKTERDDAAAYRKTTKDMQNADIGRGDPDDDTEWLSKRKDKR